MKIDVFPHILPRRFFDRMLEIAGGNLYMQKRMRAIPVLVDLEERFRIMDRYEGYVQVLTLASPPIEALAGPDATPALARLANDGMAELVAKHPDRFPGCVASLPMNNPDAALREIDRAIDGLGATGVQIFSNVNGRPLDEPEWAPLFDRMAARRLPIWLHPARPAVFADYPGEKRSRYDIWWAFGWPYETTAAMARLVFAGLFDRHPDLAIITHHMGAMLPYFEGRAGGGLDQLGSRTEDPDDAVALARLGRRPLDYFKMFYGDTALFGAQHAMECGLAFFGAERVLFGTDMPFDPEKGPGFIRDTIGAMETRPATPADEAKMAHGYAMVTGRPQAVMVHVIVGTANALGGVINAARGGVPMLFTAGRNPITEAGFRGSRERQIHWAQESFDQGAIVREFVKWDYELRNFAQLETVVDRALAVTQAEPQAPVYLTLPREVLAERHDSFEYADPSRAPRPSDVVAAGEAVEEAARIIATAKNPVVIAKALGRDPRAVEAMVKLAEVAALPVVDHFHTHVNFPQDHPLHAGFDATPYLDTADAIVVVESDAPWFPHVKSPRPETKLVQIGVDPLFSRYPIRGFGADVALAGTARLPLAAPADPLPPPG